MIGTGDLGGGGIVGGRDGHSSLNSIQSCVSQLAYLYFIFNESTCRDESGGSVVSLFIIKDLCSLVPPPSSGGAQIPDVAAGPIR